MLYLFGSPPELRGAMSSYDPVPRYGAYVLRIWEVRSQEPDAEPVWRFSLEPVHSRERRGFPDLESLMAYLRTLTGSHPVQETAVAE